MSNLQSLLAVIIGLIAFFVDTVLAVTLISIYLIVVGLIGLMSGGATSTTRTVTKPAPQVEKE